MVAKIRIVFEGVKIGIEIGLNRRRIGSIKSV